MDLVQATRREYVLQDALERLQDSFDIILLVDLIDINPHQARQQFDEAALEELAASIKEHDVLQPIRVIHTGERRYRAAPR